MVEPIAKGDGIRRMTEGAQDQVKRLATKLYSRGRASPADIVKVERALGVALPTDYSTFTAEIDGAEGWVGDQYIALWRISDLTRINDKLETSRFVPGTILIGSDGGGEGIGLEVGPSGSQVVFVPLVGLPLGRTARQGTGFRNWLLSHLRSSVSDRRVDATMLGRNVYEKQPVILGGDPVDPANKAIVPIDKLLDLAAWWNRQIAADGREAEAGRSG